MFLISRIPSAPEEDSALSTREILVFFLPLAATSTMMSASVPIINSGLARLEDPTLNLAAFGLAFALGILLESPVFALQQAVVAWYGGAGRYRHLIGYSLAVGLAVMLGDAAIAFSPAGRFILERFMGADPELAEPAAAALKVSVIFPPLIALRSAIQAILISRRATAIVGWGTLFRLTALTGLIFLVAPSLPWGGPVVAMGCLATAVMVETVIVAIYLHRSAERPGGSSPAQEAGRTFQGRTRFILPLAAMMALGTLTNPIINGFIARTENPEAALAAYAVVASLVWFVASPFLRYSSVVIALGRDARTLARLRNFVWKGVGGLTLLVVLAHFTPLWHALLRGAMGLSPELAARVRLPLIILSFQPLVAALIAFNQGVLTRGARTWIVGLGGVSRVVGIVSVGFLGVALGWDGALLGGILLGLAFLAELAMLALIRRRPEAAAGADAGNA